MIGFFSAGFQFSPWYLSAEAHFAAHGDLDLLFVHALFRSSGVIFHFFFGARNRNIRPLRRAAETQGVFAHPPVLLLCCFASLPAALVERSETCFWPAFPPLIFRSPFLVLISSIPIPLQGLFSPQLPRYLVSVVLVFLPCFLLSGGGAGALAITSFPCEEWLFVCLQFTTIFPHFVVSHFHIRLFSFGLVV